MLSATRGRLAATPNPVGVNPSGRGALQSFPRPFHREVAAMPDMYQVPSSLAGLLSLLEGCFTAPTFRTFCMLTVGFIARIRENTVCGMLQGAGLAGVWHHSRAHAFFAYRRWAPDELGLRLLDLLVSLLVSADAPIALAVDDTLFGRSGRKVYGAHYLHDGAQPEGSGRRTRWGNCWVTVVLVIALPCTGGRMVGLPLLFRLFRPKDDQHPDRPSQPELARTLIDLVIKRFSGRKIELVMDGAYASRAWQGLPEHVGLTTRMRANAALYELPPARRKGQHGRTPLKGKRMGSLTEIAKAATFKPVSLTGRDGRTRTALVHEFTCLWYKPFHTRPLKVILVRNPNSNKDFDIAIASTDTGADGSADHRTLRRALGDRDRPPRGQEPWRRRRPQPRPQSRQAHRAVRLPDDDDHDRVVSALRRPPNRPHRAPPPRSLVPPKDQRQLHRHARRAAARAHPTRVSHTRSFDNHTHENQRTPTPISVRRRVKRESRVSRRLALSPQHRSLRGGRRPSLARSGPHR